MRKVTLSFRVDKSDKDRWSDLAKDREKTLTSFLNDTIEKGVSGKAIIPKDVEDAFLKVYETKNKDGTINLDNSLLGKIMGILALGKKGDMLSLSLSECSRIADLMNAIFKHLVVRDSDMKEEN